MFRIGNRIRTTPGCRPLRVLLALSLSCLTSVSYAKTVQYISPVPGSTMVSQESNIIIGVKGTLDPSVVADPSLLSVEGSISGEHGGALILSDDQQAILFQPTSPFAPGEDVSVRLRSGVQTREGDIVEPLAFKFTVSPLSPFDQAMLLSKAAPASVSIGMQSKYLSGNQPARLEKTAGDSLSPDFSKMVVVDSSNPTAGDIFLSTFKLAVAADSVHASLVPSSDQYLMILNNESKPVFYRKAAGLATDFKLQPNGYLTYFDNGMGAFYEMDSSYAVIDSFRCGNGYATDVHELQILPNGHALLLGTDPQTVDMSKIVPGGNTAATVIGNVIQELDANKNVVFQWRTFDHFQITDATHEDLTAATIDDVHANAIDVDKDGNLLLSSRHLDEITKINRQTGDIIWRWGGKNNQFTFTNDTIGFSHQHSIRRSPTGGLMMFDDGNFHNPRFSRAVEYSMDEQAKTVTQIWQFRHAPDVFAAAMGSVQRLSDGNTLIGWGTTSPAVTEVRPDGGVAFELQLPDSVVSYRAFRFPWNPQSVVTAVQSNFEIPNSFSLAQNYPNPFNPSTVIQFTVPRQSDVSLKIYDVVGREIATLVEGTKPAGTYSIRLDASRFASGVYFYRLTAPGLALTKAMALVK
jgi:hypothetical protein